jgi:hypothetical protein
MRDEALDILCQTKPLFPQKRSALLLLGVPKGLIDEIEILSTPGTLLSPAAASGEQTYLQSFQHNGSSLALRSCVQSG